jgi:hypothetical protein
MTESRSGRGRGRVPAIVYAGLCLVAAVVGWAGVVVIVPAVEAGSPTPSPIAAAPTIAPTPSPTATPTPTPTSTPTPEPTPVPSPTKAPFLMDVYRPGTFVSQMNRDYCMAGAVQNMVNIIGPESDLTTAKQKEIGGLIVSLTTKDDSHNGGFGPGGWALTMPQLGAGQYKLVIDSTFDQAMHDAALALARTARPVGLLTWWGAHSWVMTGFRADADPLLFPDTFVLKGAFIVDPFYPRISSIWGQTLGPDTFRDMAAMAHNYIGWKRPEGRYPGRDGKWLLVIPVDS